MLPAGQSGGGGEVARREPGKNLFLADLKQGTKQEEGQQGRRDSKELFKFLILLMVIPGSEGKLRK